MIQELIDIAFHKYVRTGERIRIYNTDGSFLTEDWAVVKGWGKYAAVKLRTGHPYTAIRRDQFVWTPRFCCWSYKYDE